MHTPHNVHRRRRRPPAPPDSRPDQQNTSSAEQTKNKQPNKQSNKQTNQTHKTNEQTNKQTNKQPNQTHKTNQQTNKQTKHGSTSRRHRRRPAERVGARAAAAGACAGAMGPIACAIASSGRGSPLPVVAPRAGSGRTVGAVPAVWVYHTCRWIRWPSGCLKRWPPPGAGGLTAAVSRGRRNCCQLGASKGAVGCIVASCTLQCRIFHVAMSHVACCILHV